MEKIMLTNSIQFIYNKTVQMTCENVLTLN